MATTKQPKKSTKAPKVKKSRPVAGPKPGRRDEDSSSEGDGDDEDDEIISTPPKKTLFAKKTVLEPASTIPARRLTPEAKEKLNAMLQKGISLQEALQAVARWEPFVAPPREPPPPAASDRKNEPGVRHVDFEDEGPEVDELGGGDSDD